MNTNLPPLQSSTNAYSDLTKPVLTIQTPTLTERSSHPSSYDRDRVKGLLVIGVLDRVGSGGMALWWMMKRHFWQWMLWWWTLWILSTRPLCDSRCKPGEQNASKCCVLCTWKWSNEHVDVYQYIWCVASSCAYLFLCSSWDCLNQVRFIRVFL